MGTIFDSIFLDLFFIAVRLRIFFQNVNQNKIEHVPHQNVNTYFLKLVGQEILLLGISKMTAFTFVTPVSCKFLSVAL